jgi:hypothetical protein
MEITYRHLTRGLMSADGMQLTIGIAMVVVILVLWAWYEYQN